jgi:hypothetical protein
MLAMRVCHNAICNNVLLQIHDQPLHAHACTAPWLARNSQAVSTACT